MERREMGVAAAPAGKNRGRRREIENGGKQREGRGESKGDKDKSAGMGVQRRSHRQKSAGK